MHSNAELQITLTLTQINKPSALGTWTKIELFSSVLFPLLVLTYCQTTIEDGIPPPPLNHKPLKRR